MSDEKGHWSLCRYYVEKNKEMKTYYCPTPQDPPYACTVCSESEPKIITCFYRKSKESYLNYSHNICDILSLETLLLHYNGFILHSSFIRWQQQGILFSAPSGTGKSTQADLWVEYEGAEIINGDRAGLRLIDGVWQAYGLPYAGSSHIYRNENAPVAAVVVLRQAKENRIRRLRAAEAIRFLYPEVTAHHWDREFVDRILNLLMELTAAVPVYLLECLPDRGAVELVKDTIFCANLPASE
ncbi:MAG: hypothetical protein PUG60_06985 [Lachnospiraceae bacterium]|nr:hypothetical protein [Lachnospiraceae bacterium]